MWGEFTGGKRIFNPPSPVLKARVPFVPFLGCTALYVIFVLGFSCVVYRCIYIFISFCTYIYFLIIFYIMIILLYLCTFSFATSARYLPPTCYHHLYILSHVE